MKRFLVFEWMGFWSLTTEHHGVHPGPYGTREAALTALRTEAREFQQSETHWLSRHLIQEVDLPDGPKGEPEDSGPRYFERHL